MELEAVRIRLRQQRPPPFLHVRLQSSFCQIGDRALRRHHDVNRPQTPLDGHVQEKLHQPRAAVLDRDRVAGGHAASPEQLRMALRTLDLRRRDVGVRRKTAVEGGGSATGIRFRAINGLRCHGGGFQLQEQRKEREKKRGNGYGSLGTRHGKDGVERKKGETG
eukprot:TRINITY_DN27469_c0_g1_i1.p2 TRINITY_DN27469_c0_g1~~TRINITY_DN27469_c0_g1_i1.p2  ORF type:complete len:164 (+),score=16.13 TRINITY_DN27469_c0_g1_i1:518-1009(+)